MALNVYFTELVAAGFFATADGIVADHIAKWNEAPLGIALHEKEKSLTLLQNYPNPFYESTVISYQLAKSEKVKLVIKDIIGREIKTLFNGNKQSGNYSLNFNGNDL